MDAFTAGSLLIASKFAVAAVMTGIFCLLPREKCTLDWALAAALVACGATISILNAGAPRYAVLITGNGAIILGMVMQWRGVRRFYHKRNGWLGWIIGALFLVVYVWVLAAERSIGDRAAVLSATILAMLALNTYELGSGFMQRRSIGGALALGSASFLVLCYLVNVMLAFSGWVEFSHAPNSAVAVALTYALPFGGSLTLTIGLIVLLYERHFAGGRQPADDDVVHP